MPKVQLIFNLPSEEEEFKYAKRGAQYWNIIESIQAYVRKKLKYEELTNDERQAYENISEFIHNEIVDLSYE